uniref:Uncharacterized protein n=1 Tax=Proboscia inermis TaxID=420281 RepID=A0A7S0C5C3_9STRA|mmetsp:Transcript_28451/g.28789  ORF Transcript_28451/g.28789 Transcript_28451/m.28789 type:complete len:166 (+) Transcript_28451:213-710(+)
MEPKEESQECAHIWAYALALKQLSVDYMHPATIVDPCVFGRNSFERQPSVDLETVEESEERAHILADATALNKLATNYMHPGDKISAVDPCAFGSTLWPSWVVAGQCWHCLGSNRVFTEAAAKIFRLQKKKHIRAFDELAAVVPSAMICQGRTALVLMAASTWLV